MVNSADSPKAKPAQGLLRLLSFLKPSHQHSAFSATLLLMSAVMLSRVIGYLREAYIAWAFGVGPATDAYVAGFTIPDGLTTWSQAVPLPSRLFRSTPAFLREKRRGSTEDFPIIITVMTMVLGSALADRNFHSRDFYAGFSRFNPEQLIYACI